MNLAAAEKHIKRAWIAGIVSAAITLIFTLITHFKKDFLSELGFDWWNLINVLLTLGLTFGVYRKSRVSALLLSVYLYVPRFIFGP